MSSLSSISRDKASCFPPQSGFASAARTASSSATARNGLAMTIASGDPRRIVVAAQYRSGTPAPAELVPRLPAAGRHFAIAIGAAEVDPDRSPDPRLAFDPGGTARLARHSIDHRQAKTGALADFLGGEERLEGPAEHVRAHTRAGVGDA